MNHRTFVFALAVAVLAVPAAAQQTPKPVVDSYSALADSILALRDAEAAYVRSLLDGHRHAAAAAMKAGANETAAAHVALFANEGDNAVGGVRKRLLEGGHHHNAAGEEQGLYEEGFVVVTREVKAKLLEAAATLRTGDEAARQAAWGAFDSIAGELIGE